MQLRKLDSFLEKMDHDFPAERLRKAKVSDLGGHKEQGELHAQCIGNFAWFAITRAVGNCGKVDGQSRNGELLAQKERFYVPVDLASDAEVHSLTGSTIAGPHRGWNEAVGLS